MTEELDTLSPQERTQFWEEHIRAWQGTDISQAAYCRKNGLIRHRFGYWKKRLDPPQPKDISFVPLALPPNRMGSASRLISVVTPNGYTLELGSGFDPILIGQLMHAIRDL
jgi:hypothetical protein